MAIKSNVGSWSDDFYPVSSKIFSNVQRMSLNISRDEIEKVHNQISIIFGVHVVRILKVQIIRSHLC